jgi:hypothetical protein
VGGLGWSLFIPGATQWLGGLKRQDTTQVVFDHLCVFGTSCASGATGAMWWHRGVISEAGTVEEAAEKCFHVLATSLEALSTI